MTQIQISNCKNAWIKCLEGLLTLTSSGVGAGELGGGIGWLYVLGRLGRYTEG